jgi:DNA-binding transcriptional regulator LsrR (DeoR family)
MTPRARPESETKTSPAKRKAARRARRRRADEPRLEEPDVMATVCSYFCSEGLTAVAIQERLLEEHRMDVSREAVYACVRKAASRGWIRFDPPKRFALERDLRREHPWLQEVSVVETALSHDVSYRGAEMLLGLLQQHYPGGEVHIGFSGGRSLRTLARRFAELLREPGSHLPKKIVFHAVVAGFDVHDPTTDPNAFFTYFVDDYAMNVETAFVALHTPAMGDPELQRQLMALKGVQEPFERASEIDVIVTSATSWLDEHSMLKQNMDESSESMKKLEKAGCLGDLLWQPIGADGPLDLKTGLRAMTIMDLGTVSKLVSRKKHVLLAAGPCAKCHKPKSDVVKAILDQERQLITHMVVDSGCARSVLSTR